MPNFANGSTCEPLLQDEELYQLLSGVANLESSVEAVRVVRDPHINIGKGIAYVLFKTRVCAYLCKIFIFWIEISVQVSIKQF